MGKNKCISQRFKALIACIYAISFPSFAFGYSLSNMSLEEKIGQLMIVSFQGSQANADAQFLIQKIKVGGFIYYNWANQLDSFEKVQKLSLGLQHLALKNPDPIALFICADQEGGKVARLKAGFTEFPGNRALAATLDPELAYQSAQAIAEQMLAAGLNMNLAPVVDVNSNENNPVIGLRSFGQDPNTTISFGEQALRGYKKANMIAVLKHFPGHGAVTVDSHDQLPYVGKTIEELEKVDLAPFSKLASDAQVIMTAHLLVPALDQDNCSTFSKKTIEYLRKNLGFQGIVMTDSLTMGGALAYGISVQEAAIQALNAGADLLLFGGKTLDGSLVRSTLSVEQIYAIQQALVLAVKNQRIAPERIDEAVEKILLLKKKYLHDALAFEYQHIEKKQEHDNLAKKIARSALHAVIDPNNFLKNLSKKNIVCFYAPSLQSKIASTSFFSNNRCFSLDILELNPLKNPSFSHDVSVVFTDNLWKDPLQKHQLEVLKKPLVIIETCSEVKKDLHPMADAIVYTFSATAVSLQAAWDELVN